MWALRHFEFVVHQDTFEQPVAARYGDSTSLATSWTGWLFGACQELTTDAVAGRFRLKRKSWNHEGKGLDSHDCNDYGVWEVGGLLTCSHGVFPRDFLS